MLSTRIIRKTKQLRIPSFKEYKMLGIVIGSVGLASLLCCLFGDQIELFVSRIFSIIFIMSVVVGIVGMMALIFVGVVYKPVRFISLARRLWPPRGIYPPSSFTIKEWKKLIKQINTARQKKLLLRTNHQTLGLTPEAFIDLLYEIQPLIKKEPALSAYWERRHQLEEILKQEKHG